MKTDTIHYETTVARDGENAKTAWHRPSVTRIDIKRTLSGVGSSTDSLSPTT